MKQMLLFVFLLVNAFAFATIRTVSNNPSTIAQFNTIQAAVDAANTGDTIFVHGSPNNYSGFTITNKQLVVMGPGWVPDKNLPHLAQIVSSINFSGAGSAGSELQGLVIATNIQILTLGIDNIRIIRNRLFQNTMGVTPNVGGTISGYLFEGNWFDNFQVNSNSSYTIQNFLFQNNLFYESGCCVGGNINGFVNTVNVLFNHNLWYGPGGGTRDAFAGNTRFVIISNNIFVRRHASANLSSSTFNNNITFNAGDDTPWNSNGNVNSGGNVAGQDPQMVDQATVNAGTNSPLSDFTIAAGPANNSGSDGKDIGLLYDASGSLNWINARNSRLPRIFSMNITTPTVAPGRNVSVTVEARRSN